MMNPSADNISLWLSAVSSVGTVIAAAFAAWAAWSAKKAVDYQRQSVDLAGLNQFLMREYRNRKFRYALPPKIEGRTVEVLRQAHWEAKKQYESNRAIWETESHYSRNGTWQNATAYETSLALESVGLAVYTGFVPLRLLLAEVAGAIIDDLILCKVWVDSYRKHEEITWISDTGLEGVSFQRRHAEWIALIAATWMWQQWKYPNARALCDAYQGDDKVRAKISDISKADGQMMPAQVQQEIRRLIGIKLKPK